jgi:hypothetical protein
MTSKEARANSAAIEFKAYKNDDEKTGVSKYAILKDGIVLIFRNKREYYLYDFTKPGKKDVEEMITRAIKGEKLSTYVSQVIGINYADKWMVDIL